MYTITVKVNVKVNVEVKFYSPRGAQSTWLFPDYPRL